MLERHRDKHKLWYFKVCLEPRPLMLGAACFTGRYCLASYLLIYGEKKVAASLLSTDGFQ